MKKLLSLSLILSLIVPYTVPLTASLAVENAGNEDSAKIVLENNQTKINSEQLNFNINNESSNTDLVSDRRNSRRGNYGRRHSNRRWRHGNWRRPVYRYNYRNASRHWRRHGHYRRYHSNRWHYNNNWRGNIRRYNYRHYPRYNRRNYRRYYNRYYNRNYRTIINRPYYNWRWNDGRRWYPNDYYWGGGFWGNVLASVVTVGLTNAIIDSNDNYNPNYIVIKENSPGYYLFNNYGLTQVQCDTAEDLVFIYGPQDSLICAFPNGNVSAGYYDVNTEGLVLIPRNY